MKTRSNQTQKKVPVLIMYTYNGLLKVDTPPDINIYMVYGFLSLYLEQLKERLKSEMNGDEGNES